MALTLENLPIDVHHEIIQFVSTLDCKHLSQCCSKLQDFYRPESWRRCKVVSGKTDYGEQAKARNVPLAVLLRPNKYSWFLNQCTHEIYMTGILSFEENSIQELFKSPFDRIAFSAVQKIHLLYYPFFHFRNSLFESTFYNSILSIPDSATGEPFLNINLVIKQYDDYFLTESLYPLKKYLQSIAFDGEYRIPSIPYHIDYFQNLTDMSLCHVDRHSFSQLIGSLSIAPSLKSLSLNFHVWMERNTLKLEQTILDLATFQFSNLKTCHVRFNTIERQSDVLFDCYEVQIPSKEVYLMANTPLVLIQPLVKIPFVTHMSIKSTAGFRVFNHLFDYIRIPNTSFVSVPLKVQWETSFMNKICFAKNLTMLELSIRDAYLPTYNPKFVGCMMSLTKLKRLTINDKQSCGYFFRSDEHICDSILNPVFREIREQMQPFLHLAPENRPQIDDKELIDLTNYFYEKFTSSSQAKTLDSTFTSEGFKHILDENIVNLVKNPLKVLGTVGNFNVKNGLVKRFCDICIYESLFYSLQSIKTLEYFAIKPNSRFYLSARLEMLLATHQTLKQVMLYTPLNPCYRPSLKHREEKHSLCKHYSIGDEYYEEDIDEEEYDEDREDNDYSIIPQILNKYTSIELVSGLFYGLVVAVVFDIKKQRKFEPKLMERSMNAMLNSPDPFYQFDQRLGDINMYADDFDGWI